MNGSLYLSPADPLLAPEPGRVLACLAGLKITGTLSYEAPRKRVFAAGEDFMRHVIYAGCSPHLRFQPEEPHDRDFCHVAVLGPYPRPEVITGENTVNPRCPACRSHLVDWQERMHTGELECPRCGRISSPWELDWRQHAAVGRLLVELRNVFPGEASPSDRLLNALADAAGMPWVHAWSGMSPEP